MPFNLNKDTINRNGRKKGSKNRRTIELEVAQKQLQQAVFQNLKPMMTAQIMSARGENYVYRVDKNEEGGEKHVMLTDGREIGEALDAIAAWDFDNHYYYISTKPANTRAFEALLDRGFGKAREFKQVDVNVQLSLSRLAQQALLRGSGKDDPGISSPPLHAPQGILRGQIIHDIAENVENA